MRVRRSGRSAGIITGLVKRANKLTPVQYDLHALHLDNKAKRIAILQTEYLDKGSPGLKDFLRLRIKSAEVLVGTIDRMRAVISTVDNVPAIVAHESCHYNQNYNTAQDQRHLLGKALQEGACDTIGELISGRNINDHLKVYGKTHDAEIWRDFEAGMYKPDFSTLGWPRRATLQECRVTQKVCRGGPPWPPVSRYTNDND